MLNCGYLPLIDPAAFPNLGLMRQISGILDAELHYFILRSGGDSNFEEYQKTLQNILDLQQEMDFHIIIHRHLDLATGPAVLGVHLTQNSSPLRQARQSMTPEQILGYSAHSLDEALKAEQAGANYLLVGAVFPTPKKTADHPILGTTELKRICRAVKIPVFAIGGITAENLIQIKDAEAYGFSALRAVFGDGNIEHNIRKLNLLWDL